MLGAWCFPPAKCRQPPPPFPSRCRQLPINAGLTPSVRRLPAPIGSHRRLSAPKCHFPSSPPIISRTWRLQTLPIIVKPRQTAPEIFPSPHQLESRTLDLHLSTVIYSQLQLSTPKTTERPSRSGLRLTQAKSSQVKVNQAKSRQKFFATPSAFSDFSFQLFSVSAFVRHFCFLLSAFSDFSL